MSEKLTKLERVKKPLFLVKTKLNVDALNSPLFLWSVINIYIHVQLYVLYI